MSEWIKTAERMPKKRGDYLCWHPDIPAANGWPGLAARPVVLTWTGKRFVTSFPISYWQPIDPPIEPKEQP